MITLIMFLFLAGGQNKPQVQPTTAKHCEITGDSRVEFLKEIQPAKMPVPEFGETRVPKTYTYCCEDKGSIAAEDEGVQKPSPIAPHRNVVKLTGKIKHKKKLNKAHEGLWGAGDDTERPSGAPCPDPECTNPSPVMSTGTIVSVGSMVADPQFIEPVIVHTKDATMVKMSDDEYTHLQALRQSVVDEEKRLAVKYGAETRHIDENHFMVIPDHVEYHGQFLLIEKGK